ncbi:vomeronasal type-1 receptor 90-like [Ctenodactylus gundi]
MEMNKNRKHSSLIDIHNIFFIEVSFGIMANTVLLLSYILICLLGHRPKLTDLTIGHLAFIHIVMLLTVGLLCADIFGFQNSWNDIVCILVIFLYRLMRGLSFCTTCLLSVLQAIILSPRSSCLAILKHKSSYHILFSFFLLWIFNMIISGRFLISITATPNVSSHSLMYVTEFCSFRPLNYLLQYISFTLMTFRDVFFIGLMALSSGYMVFLLHRHKRQCQHLHSTSLSPKVSPEQRASKSILLLMSFFIVMYFLDIVITSISGILRNNNTVYHCVQMLVGNGYATLSPLVLIRSDKQMIQSLTSIWRKGSKV